MKQLVDQQVKRRLDEVRWYKTVDHAVLDVVHQEITATVVKDVIKELDRTKLIELLSTTQAELLINRLGGD